MTTSIDFSTLRAELDETGEWWVTDGTGLLVERCDTLSEAERCIREMTA